jgi:hypothetical protein
MKRNVRSSIILIWVLIVVALLGTSPVQAASTPGGYVIVFKDTVDVLAAVPEVARAHGLQVGYVYEYAVKGMSATVPAGRLAALQNDPRVAYVVEDMVRSIDAQTIPTGIQRTFADSNANLDIDSTDDYRVDVDVAVIDTGVDFQHPDLNTVGGVTCSGGGPFKRSCTAGGDDNHYHGTHVAGTIGAIDNGAGVVGVAPGARIWAVKVLNSQGSGYTSWIVAGIDWVTANASTIEVANMSLGGSGFNQAEFDAIQGAVNKGVAFAVSAGNSDADASGFSPAAFSNVLTVSALADFDGESGGLGGSTCRTDQDDTLADFSNWGSVVDIAAPGVCILSTYPLEQGEYGTISGTSMASPHAAGALALLASSSNPNSANDVFNLYGQVINSGNSNWTDDSGDGIKERLLDVSNTAIFDPTLIPGGGGGGNNPPTVDITSPGNGASFSSGTSVSFAGSAFDAEDGNLTNNLVWTSGLDGQIGTGGSFSAALSDGTHTITASVTDSGGSPGNDSITITVGGGNGGFTLSVTAYKVKGNRYADLTWSGATSANVDVYRDAVLVATTPNDGAHVDGPLGKGGGPAQYQVCEAGTSTCSNTVAVAW